MITRKSFRIQDPTTGYWLKGLDQDFEYLWTDDKAEAMIFSERERSIWEEDELKLVEVTEAEVMESLGQEIAPRLPGF